MSRLSKICWGFCAASVIILFAARFIMGGWNSYLWVPLILTFVSFLGGVIFDFRLYIEFFTTKTTKHGMNMGAMILSVLVAIVVGNYFSVRYNKTWDLSEGKIFSLAEQSKELVQGLQEELLVKVFYHGNKEPQYEQIKAQVLDSLERYKEASKNVRVQLINAYVKREEADAYLKGIQESNAPIVFVEYKGKKIRVETPLQDEQQITNAILRATREGSKKIYFLAGHGERAFSGTDDSGINSFKQALTDSAFLVEELNLFEKENIPEDAAVLAIIGPQVQLQAGEIEKIKEYLNKGGNLFVAADPGQRHGIGRLTEYFGVQFEDNFVISPMAQLMNRGASAAIGVAYDGSHEITKRIMSKAAATIFDVASGLKKNAEAPEGVSLTDLVMTNEQTATIKTLSSAEAQKAFKDKQTRKVTLAMAVTGTAKAAAPEKSEQKPDAAPSPTAKYSAVIFGDSDFVTDKDVNNLMNMDLALNTMAYLAKEQDLISIRPKPKKATQMSLSQTKANAYAVGSIGLPLILFAFSVILFFRRRGA